MQDIQQRQATSAGGIVEEAASTLHPAAAVFRDEILGNVGESNKTLEANNARFRHLANLIQEVKLVFNTISYNQGEHIDDLIRNSVDFERHETLNVNHQLSRGSIITTLDGERLVLPIEDAPAHPILDNGAIGLVYMYLGGIPFGMFPDVNFRVTGSADVVVEGDGSVHLNLHLSKEIAIEGKLHSAQMTNTALFEHVEQLDFMSSMRVSRSSEGVAVFESQEQHQQRKGIVFTPLSISIQVTPWLEKTLALVDQVSSPGGSRADVELEYEDELRCLVVEALGDSEHNELFNEYLALKQESSTLTELSSLFLGVTVRHSEGEFTVTLDEGKRSGNFWHILGDDDRPVMPVAELHRMEVSVFGMRLRLCNRAELIQVSSLLNHDTGNWSVWPMQFQAGCSNLKFFFLVWFNWSDFTEEEIHDILDNFSSKISNALVYNPDDETFPSTFKATLAAICCHPFLAEARLDRAGLL